MKENPRWPKKGDNPFLVLEADRNIKTFAYLRWLSSAEIDDSYLATAFKEAADKIVDDIYNADGLGEYPDKFFMPVAYLYRHSFELIMKEIIKLGIVLELVKQNMKLSSILKKHNL